MISAEQNKRAIENLIARANAKTEKGDTTITSVVNSLITGYGQGGGSGGECSGNHIIEVDTLPTENIDEEAIYKVEKAFGDIVIYNGEVASSLLEKMPTAQCYSVATKPTENIVESNLADIWAFYYIENENDIFLYANIGNGAEWLSLSLLTDMTFQGAISDVSEASSLGYYAVGGTSYYQYVNGTWERMIYESKIPPVPEPTTEERTVTPQTYTQTVTPSSADYLSKVTVNPIPSNYIVPSGTKTITENGTHDVNTYSSARVEIPTTYTVQTVADLPSNALDGALAIVLGGE